MSNLTEYAQSELRRAGLFDKDADYNGALGNAVIDLVKTFAKQGHSGMSASLTLQMFERVARFQPLSPLTSDPTEWMDVSHNTWQSRRNPACFSTDGGKTYYDLDEENRPTHTSAEPTVGA